jgi:tetratricopeptide (TPR) repeat protein
MSRWNGAFQRLVSKAPDSHQARQILAEGLESQERFAEAANQYRQILKAEPRLPDMHYRLGRAILRSDASGEAEDKALAEFRKELEINPVSAAALAEIGEIYLKRSELEQASRSFSEAFRLQPGYVPVRIGLAKALIAEKQWSKALEHLEAAAKLAPEEEAVYYNLMLAYRGLGRPADAHRALEAFERLKHAKQQNRSPVLRGTPPQ